ncbi:hypothetical protein Ccrd_017424 [Cynara cardunculus var. scolymus]|uniref:Uncharacterized protein n=1 Tax=Cynara cardunculus var. scolymus TaxID=59895 RepID=A0A118K2F2_CYNCS|nr:hypothetical protein Ccrd_017424 [Cynara cardunculus var. scolymus]
MKRPGFVAASMAAASATTAISASKPSDQDHGLKSINHLADSSPEKRSCCSEKFAPRFDGLRFIETLVTAHR